MLKHVQCFDDLFVPEWSIFVSNERDDTPPPLPSTFEQITAAARPYHRHLLPPPDPILREGKATPQPHHGQAP
jgi:hypothetical protein